jgi:hypothetical protein
VGKAKRAHHSPCVRFWGTCAWGDGEGAVVHLTLIDEDAFLLRRRNLGGYRGAVRLDHAGVGVDVGLRRIGDHQQVALLPCSTD